MIDLTIHPECPEWLRRLHNVPAGQFDGYDLDEWRRKTRCELGLPIDRPVVATGHQTLLWHPGILAKYLVVDGFARRNALGTANLVVDQHVADFGAVDVPVRRGDDGLAVRTLRLTQPRTDVPMGLHAPFSPAAPPSQWRYATDAVAQGVSNIVNAVARHDDAPNAALQMARALRDLMAPWVDPMPDVTATDLMESSLARAVLRRMIDDPRRAAEAYNAALKEVPEAGIRPLLVRDDYIELPIWRIRSDGRRMHAYDNDVEAHLNHPTGPRLLPKALFMTALIRIGMCDLFVHGTGGARYDRAMEVWMDNWLGLAVSPIAVATATLRLPLAPSDEQRMDLAEARTLARRVRHDPESVLENSMEDGAPGPGSTKKKWLERIEALPARSIERRRAYYAMHADLETVRQTHEPEVERHLEMYRQAQRQAEDMPIAARRTWPFPLYDPVQIDELADACRGAVSCCV